MPVEIIIRKLSKIKIFLKKITISVKLNINILVNCVKIINKCIQIIKIYYGYRVLIDIICIDWPSKIYRFEIIYNLLNIYFNMRLFIKVEIQENTVYHFNTIENLFSITNIFQGANWLERENWDMFGILFFNHPDLRRILTDYGFDGFPLRKDFPLTGFVELRYDEEQKSILYEKVELSQEFRFFDFESPWKLTT